jgi:hypothetical protein
MQFEIRLGGIEDLPIPEVAANRFHNEKAAEGVQDDGILHAPRLAQELDALLGNPTHLKLRMHGVFLSDPGL